MTPSHSNIPSHEITPESTYLNRRTFMRAGILAATTLATAGIYRALNRVPAGRPPGRRLANLSTAPTTFPAARALATTSPAARQTYLASFTTDETKTPLQDITHYNNFYEFSTGKQEVAGASANFITRPWTVTVAGLCSNPKTFDIDDLLNIAPPEERIYRMRCVEAWSMVIPWAGFSLSKLLDRVRPTGAAKYVAFETLFDPSRMPNQNTRVLDWPYVEGLRMDEAMHPLTLLASGIYGHELPPQDGAPLRLVVPWKYGFKGIKSIVKITLTDQEPPTTWNLYAPNEYGFYANVNPNVDHPRWSQATEQRIGEYRRRKTLIFNGYANDVAHLYTGMDLRKYY